MSPLPKRILGPAREALDLDVTDLPVTGPIEALSHPGTDLASLMKSDPRLTETKLRDVFARAAALLNILEDELATANKKTGAMKSAATAASDTATYKNFPVEELETFITPSLPDGMTDAIGYVDGCSKGNPGQAGIGVVLLQRDGKIIARISQAIGLQTNNFAEYSAFIKLLQTARDLGVRKLYINSDSELMVKQFNGEYKVKNPAIKQLMAQVSELTRGFDVVRMRHIPREENALADALSTWCIDREK